eukprot:636356-Pleurochrysis_carterae.AAC.4
MSYVCPAPCSAAGGRGAGSRRLACYLCSGCAAVRARVPALCLRAAAGAVPRGRALSHPAVC